MKKIFILVSMIVLLVASFLGITIFLNNDKDNEVEEVYQVKKDSNNLSMMLETEPTSGEYEMTTRSSWPTIEDGYIFNSSLSKCENGSKLRWDDENNAVVMSASVSDKCYVYFDKFVPPVVVDVVASGGVQSIDINVVVESKYKIEKYYYTLIYGSWTVSEESIASNYYKDGIPVTGQGDDVEVQVYVIDEYGQKSNVYTTTEHVTCFVAGTKISTPNGLIDIEDIKVGDYVYTINETTNEKEIKKVLQTMINETNLTYKLYINNTIIEASPRHPFYVVDKGWTRAYNLKKGDLVLTSNGSFIIDKKIVKYYSRPLKVYNLSIEDNHNFLVTDSEFLVHNARPSA